MGMLEYLFLSSKVGDLADRVADVHTRSQERVEGDFSDIRDTATALRRDIDELALFARTTTTLLIEKGVFTEQEFLDRMLEVDRSDGTEDGRYAPP